MQRICLCLLAALLLLCAGCAAPLQGPADLPEDADALVLLDVQARGQDVVATVSAATFAADGTMQAYDAPAALLDAQGERGEGVPPPVCDFSFDESGRLLALNERA